MPPTVKPVKYVVFVGIFVAVLILAVVVWRQHEAPDPAGDFKTAMATMLTQKGLTCTTTTTETAAARVTTQKTALDLASKARLVSTTTLASKNTAVNTEEINTKTDSYVRYTAIRAAITGKDGAQLNFKKALNTWSKAPLEKNEPSLFETTALGGCIVPLGGLTSAQVAALSPGSQAGTVFTTDFSKARQEKLDGAAVTAYPVTIKPEPYVKLMQQVAKIYGADYLADVSSNEYASRTPEKVTVYVDAANKRIQKIDDSSRHRVVTFTDYGSVPRITIPEKTITSEALQQLVNAQ